MRVVDHLRWLIRAGRPSSAALRPVLGGLVAALGMTCAAWASAAEAPRPIADGELTVCLDPSYPPMEYFQNAGDAEPVGFDVDLAAGLARHWNVKLRIITSDFAGLLPALQSQRCDVVVSGVTIQEKRTKVLSAVPYLKTTRVILVKGDNPFRIKGPKDLSGKVVAVQAGTSFVQVMEGVNEELRAAGLAPATVQTYPKATEVFQQLLIGRAAAIVTNDTEAAYREIVSPGQYRIVHVFPKDELFGVYFRPDDAMARAVRDAIGSLRKDGTLAAAVTRWKLPASAADVP